MPRSPIYDILPPWSSRIRPYPPGKPIEEVERELGHTAIKMASNENPLGPSPKARKPSGITSIKFISTRMGAAITCGTNWRRFMVFPRNRSSWVRVPPT